MTSIESILLTGGAGFIGSAFIRHIIQETQWTGRIVNLDSLTYAGNIANLDVIAKRPNYTFVHGSISDADLLDQLHKTHGFDLVVNFAAESHVDRSIVNPRSFMETNVLGVFNLLEFVRRHSGIHMHQVSTDEVYGSLGPTGLFTEKTAYDPRSPYSASKASADHLVRAYAHTYGISTTISNCSNNYGPYQFPEKLVPLMILNCLENKSLPVYGDGSNIRDWLFVDDHVEAIWAVLQKGTVNESYNIGGNCEVRNIDLVHQLIKVVAEETETDEAVLRELITYVQDRPGHDQRYAIDFSKVESEIGWSPTRSLASGLKETVRWYLDNPKWIEGVRTGEYRAWIDENYGDRIP